MLPFPLFLLKGRDAFKTEKLNSSWCYCWWHCHTVPVLKALITRQLNWTLETENFSPLIIIEEYYKLYWIKQSQNHNAKEESGGWACQVIIQTQAKCFACVWKPAGVNSTKKKETVLQCPKHHLDHSIFGLLNRVIFKCYSFLPIHWLKAFRMSSNVSKKAQEAQCVCCLAGPIASSRSKTTGKFHWKHWARFPKLYVSTFERLYFVTVHFVRRPFHVRSLKSTLFVCWRSFEHFDFF